MEKQPLADLVADKMEESFRRRFRVTELEAIADAAQAVHEAAITHKPFDIIGRALIVLGEKLNALDTAGSKEKKRIVAIMGGGDWYDASVEHLVVPTNMDLDAEHRAYREWYHQQYCPAWRAGNKMTYLGFSEWLIRQGARQTTDHEVLEFWEV